MLGTHWLGPEWATRIRSWSIGESQAASALVECETAMAMSETGKAHRKNPPNICRVDSRWVQATVYGLKSCRTLASKSNIRCIGRSVQ